MTKTISIIGATIHGNHGAEAMLNATIGRLREFEPDANIIVFSYLKDADRKISKDRTIRICGASPADLLFIMLPFSIILALLKMVRLGSLKRFFPAGVRHLSDSHLLIDLAGVSFIDGREKFLPFNVLTLLPAILLGIPVVKFAQAMGPFRNPLNRLTARHMLSRCRQVFARGEQTADNLKELRNSNIDWRIACDLAFLLRDEDSLTDHGADAGRLITKKLEALRDGGTKIIGICPSSVVAKKAGQPYIDSFVRLIEQLLDTGYGVVLFPNATRADHMDKSFNNDLPVIRSISSMISTVRRENLITVQDDIYAREISSVISLCSIVIVSRFHAMILALLARVPPIVIGWSHKYREVMKQFGMESQVSDFDSVEFEHLLVLIRSTLCDNDQLRKSIAGNLPGIIAQSRSQIDYVLKLLCHEI